MNLKVQSTIILLVCALWTSCSESPQDHEANEQAALTQAKELVSELNQSIKPEHELGAATWNGVPVIIVNVENAGSEYMPTVEGILKAVGSFDGELQVAVQTPMEVSDAEKKSQLKDGKFILAHFDAKTGERIP